MNRRIEKCPGIYVTAFLLTLFVLPQALAGDLDDILQSCENCHGKDGVSRESDVPTISGASFYYFSDAMIAYQGEERFCPEIKYKSGDKKGDTTTMCKLAEELDDDEIEKVAKYYSEKPFVAANQSFDPALAKKGADLHDEYCEKCHADSGRSPDDDSGILAGQWTPYLREAFKHYTSGERPMVKKMKPKYEKLSEEDKEALLHFYAGAGKK